MYSDQHSISAGRARVKLIRIAQNGHLFARRYRVGGLGRCMLPFVATLIILSLVGAYALAPAFTERSWAWMDVAIVMWLVVLGFAVLTLLG